MSLARIAVVFDNRLRPETTGTYVRRALGRLVSEVEHVLPDELGRVKPGQFDAFVMIDDGLNYFWPRPLRPVAWWAIDTHVDYPRVLERAQQADVVFAAQRDGTQRFLNDGIDSAMWLPLACDPQLHQSNSEPPLWDISFVGNQFPGARAELLERLCREFPRSFVGNAYFREMARVYGRSRMAFNRSLGSDINMRVFEAMACGPLLLTNDLTDNGQAELFQDGRHLATYSSVEELLDKARHYLAHDAARCTIAAAGRAEVLTRHTYQHRAAEILRVLEQATAKSSVPVHPQSSELMKEPTYFEFDRPEVVALIPRTARHVLDIGCGAGRLGELLKQRQTVEVTGLELQPQAAGLARQRLDRVIEQNVEDPGVEFAAGSFDCIVCADVVEHLREPAAVLAKIRRWLTPQGCLVASLPNVRHHSVVSGLLDGNWTYESAGLLDNDHVRFYTRREIEKLLYRQGFEITALISKPGPGHAEWVAAGRSGTVKVGSLCIEGLTVQNAEEFFTYQFLVVARPVRASHHTPTSQQPEDEPLQRLRTAFPWPSEQPVVPLPTENLGWCGSAAQEVLRQELASPTRLVVELGAWLGLSTRFIADQAPDVHVISVDHWQGSPEHQAQPQWSALLPNLFQMFQSLNWGYRERVTPLRMTTLQGLQTIADVGLQPDLIYVDAEHSHEAVTAELELCQGLFPRARLIGDDYDAEGVQRAVNEFAYRTGRTVEPIGTDWRSWRLSTSAPVLPSPEQYGLTSIIIVTFNQLAYTRECVDSLRLRTDEPYELIFVDNGSTDGTPHYLASLTGARLIANTDNRGFPAAVNQGLAVARGEQILLLNNDTIVTTGWLRRLLNALGRDLSIGLIGPVSNAVSGPQQVSVSYRDLSGLDGFAWDWGQEHHKQIIDLDRLVGFCLLMRKEVVARIGGLDERFGIGNFEDDDYCRRARAAGFRTAVAVDSFVHHFGHRTFEGSGVDMKSLLKENERKYRDKWDVPTAPASSRTDSALTHVITQRPRYKLAHAEGGGLLLEAVRRPRLSLCMIVRNNANTIGPCLESIRPWVDEMIIVDTGSTDETPRICEQLGAQVHHWAWRDDFSAARNESLRYARGDWIFWMDSDDTIPEECGRQLRTLVEGDHSEQIFGYVMQVHCPGPGDNHDVTVVDHVKLFRNRPDLRFEHRIHEQILPAIRRASGEVAFTDIHVVHSGADHTPDGRQRKLERDFKLLKFDLQERPDHPFVLFNLGMTHADAQQYEEAVHYLTRCLQVSTPQESHVRKAYALLVSALYQLSRFDEALRWCQDGRAIYPDDKELLFRQAMLDHQLGRLSDAAAAYHAVLAVPSERHFTSIDVDLTGIKARHNLALVHEDQQRFDLAKQQWETILAERPDYAPATLGLVGCRLQLKEWHEAESSLSNLRQRADLAVDVCRLSSRLHECRGDLPRAVGELVQGLASHGEQPVLLRELARISYTAGRYADCVGVLERLLALLPDDAVALQNLAVARRDLAESQASSGSPPR